MTLIALALEEARSVNTPLLAAGLLHLQVGGGGGEGLTCCSYRGGEGGCWRWKCLLKRRVISFALYNQDF